MSKNPKVVASAVPVGIRALHAVQLDPPRDPITYNEALERDVVAILDSLVDHGYMITAPEAARG